MATAASAHATPVSGAAVSAALVVSKPSVPVQVDAPTDLELRLLQAFGAFASERVVASYMYVTRSSRVLGFLAQTTEALAAKSGLVALVGFLFAQYQRLGHPFVAAVDEAMGRRVIEAFVRILLLAQQQQQQQQQQQGQGGADAMVALEDGGVQQLKLSYQERVQALLQGEIPRLQALLLEAQCREAEALARADAAAASVPAPIVMDLHDFVPKDEVKRLRDETHEQLQDKEQQLAELKEQLVTLEKEKQKVEQNLTDVHNYQESERGRRFQDMEEELARTKLEASQKAHDLRKLELVVETLRRRRKSKSNLSNAASSDAGPPSPTNAATQV